MSTIVYETYQLQGYTVELLFSENGSGNGWEWRVSDPVKILHETQLQYKQAASAASDAFAFIAGNYEPELRDDEQLDKYPDDSIVDFLEGKNGNDSSPDE